MRSTANILLDYRVITRTKLKSEDFVDKHFTTRILQLRLSMISGSYRLSDLEVQDEYSRTLESLILYLPLGCWVSFSSSQLGMLNHDNDAVAVCEGIWPHFILLFGETESNLIFISSTCMR